MVTIKQAAVVAGSTGMLLAMLTVYLGEKTCCPHTVKRMDPEFITFPQREEDTDDTTREYIPEEQTTTSQTVVIPEDQRLAGSDATGVENQTETPVFDQRNIKVEVFPAWPQSNPHDNVLTLRAYLYSAFTAVHSTPSNTGTDIHIVAFQEGRRLMPLKCCLKVRDQKPYVGERVRLDFSKTFVNKHDPPEGKHKALIGVVYFCHFPFSAQQLIEAGVTLTSTSCPGKAGEYLRTQVPEIRPGGLGLCGKVMFGHELDPTKLVEWFEVQRLLGVDKIVLFDLNHSEVVDKVLKHYQASGLLTRLPYKLAGPPWGRDIRRGKHRDNYGDEQVLTTWDCRLRLAGYDYVLGIDMDEVVMPRKFPRLKPFLERQFKSRVKLAALFFKVQFFIDQWGPVNPGSPLHMLQYLNSTKPLLARCKYVYMPSRTHQPLTHRVAVSRGYRGKHVHPRDATLFHYRICPWRKCEMARITDRTMTRYRGNLVPRVLTVLRSVGLK